MFRVEKREKMKCSMVASGVSRLRLSPEMGVVAGNFWQEVGVCESEKGE